MGTPKLRIRAPTRRELQAASLVAFVNVVVFGALGMLWQASGFLVVAAAFAYRAQQKKEQSHS